jgi:L-ascorbate metabolism protein UlaG (beta-lactamase superfamily)
LVTEAPVSERLRITYLGHATVLIELDGLRILTDPVVVPRIGPLVRVVPKPAPELLEEIDVVLVSHAHHDHLDRRSLRKISRSARTLCARPASPAIASTGHSPEVLEPGDAADVGGIEIAAVDAVHDGRRWPLLGSSRSIGFVVRGSRSVYFAGDTDLFAGMRELEGIDVALLPVAGWGPRLPAGHLGPAEAAEAAALIGPEAAVAIHWGTLRRVGMRAGALEGPPRRFLAELEKRAPRVRGVLLRPGEVLDLGDSRPAG